MGKANRLKTEKAASTLAAPAKKRNVSKGMPTWVGTLIVVAVLVVAILLTVLFVMNSRGTFMRLRTIAKTENFKVTVPMMSYMVYTEYQTVVQTYNSYSEQFGTTIKVPAGDSTGTALDTSKALRDQIYQVKTNADGTQTTVTWFDYFADKAKADIEQILACCEYAHKNNVALTESEQDAIDLTIDNIALYAQYYGYTTNGYLASMYGNGVIEKDVRAMMELTELANKYSNIRSEEIINGVTDADVESQYNGNKSKYDTFIDYVGYTFTAKFDPIDASAAGAAETNAAKQAEYEALQAKYAGYIARLYEATTAQEFSTKLLAVLSEMFFDEEKDALLAKKEAGATLTAEEEQTCRNNAQTRAIAAVEKSSFKNVNSSDISDTELKDWLDDTGESARKPDDKLKDESVYDVYGNLLTNGEAGENATGTTYTDATSTYSVYFTTSGLHRDTGFVRSAGHILFSNDTYKNLKSADSLSGVAKVLAERVLARTDKVTPKEMAIELTTLMMEEGKLVATTNAAGQTIYTMDESVFKSYGEAYTEDGNVFYDDVTQGQMAEGFEDWLFGSSRVLGEVTYPGGVETNYGYHVMLYRGDEKPAWSHTIRVEMAEGKYDEWLKGAKAEFPVTFGDAGLWSMITG